MNLKTMILAGMLATSSCSKEPEVTKPSAEEELLDAIYNNDKPAFVDFYAEWCLPCQRAKPYIEELSLKYIDEVKFIEYDCETSSLCFILFDIWVYPTFAMFEDGEEVARQEGFGDGTELEEFIEENLGR